MLLKRGKTTFGEILTQEYQNGKAGEKYKYRLQVIAADITDRRLLVLPGDLKSFGYDPDQFSISRAVRMSMSIPFFFEPVKLRDTNGRDHYIVDGGVLSNYPIWLLDDGKKNPPWPTFGFKLTEPDKRALKPGDRNPFRPQAQWQKAEMGILSDSS